MVSSDHSPIQLTKDQCKNRLFHRKLAEIIPSSFLQSTGMPVDDASLTLIVDWLSKLLNRQGAVAWVDNLETPKALLCHHGKEWDTEVLNIKVGAAACFFANPILPDIASSFGKAWVSWAEEAGYKLLSARLSPEQIHAIQGLESSGFRYVEVYITLERDLSRHPPEGVSIDISPASPEDAERIGIIASEAYIYDRLHADPRIGQNIGDEYKRAWGINSCRGYADKVLRANVNGEIAGFITLRKKHPVASEYDFVLIDLIGVLEQFQRLSIGKNLVEAGCHWAKEQGVKYVEVGTQGSNIPSLRLYRKSGFRDTDAKVTFHWLSEDRIVLG